MGNIISPTSPTFTSWDDAQRQSLVEQWRKQLDKQMTDMKLRQWCVEQAIKLYSASPSATAVQFRQAYEDILKFVSAPFSDSFKDGPAA